MKFSIKTILRILFVLSCVNLQAAEPANAAAAAEHPTAQTRDDTTQNECPICYAQYSEDHKKETRTLPCGHTFHADCINEWTENHNTCAYCQAIIDPNLRRQINEQQAEELQPLFNRIEQFQRRVNMITSIANHSSQLIGIASSFLFGPRWIIPAAITAVGLNIAFRKDFEAVDAIRINGEVIRINTTPGYFRNRALGAISYGALGFIAAHGAQTLTSLLK